MFTMPFFKFFAGDNIDNKVSVGVGGYRMKLRDFMHQNVYVQVYVQCTMVFL